MQYKIEAVYEKGEDGYFSVHVLLDKKNKYKIVLKFTSDAINYIFDKQPSNDCKIKNFLEEYDSLYLNRLTRTALGCELRKEELTKDYIAFFKIDLEELKKIENKIEEEELALILKEGLPDLWIIH